MQKENQPTNPTPQSGWEEIKAFLDQFGGETTDADVFAYINFMNGKGQTSLPQGKLQLPPVWKRGPSEYDGNLGE